MTKTRRLLFLLCKNCQLRTAMVRRPKETNDLDCRALCSEPPPPEEDSALSMPLLVSRVVCSVANGSSQADGHRWLRIIVAWLLIHGETLITVAAACSNWFLASNLYHYGCDFGFSFMWSERNATGWHTAAHERHQSCRERGKHG